MKGRKRLGSLIGLQKHTSDKYTVVLKTVTGRKNTPYLDIQNPGFSIIQTLLLKFVLFFFFTFCNVNARRFVLSPMYSAGTSCKFYCLLYGV